MKFMYFSVKYSLKKEVDVFFSKISREKKNFIYNRLFCCNYTYYFVGMVFVACNVNGTLSNNIIDVHLRSDAMEFAEAVPIGVSCSIFLIISFADYCFNKGIS